MKLREGLLTALARISAGGITCPWSPSPGRAGTRWAVIGQGLLMLVFDWSLSSAERRHVSWQHLHVPGRGEPAGDIQGVLHPVALQLPDDQLPFWYPGPVAQCSFSSNKTIMIHRNAPWFSPRQEFPKHSYSSKNDVMSTQDLRNWLNILSGKYCSLFLPSFICDEWEISLKLNNLE